MSLGVDDSNGCPQSIAKDDILDRIYVSDITLNYIYQFKDREFVGTWATEEKFIAPRYVLCVPDRKHDNRSGMNVVVLDNVGLHYFRSDGTKKATLFPGEGLRFRGLAYYEKHGHVVSTEKVEGEGVYLIFFDLNVSKDIVKRILIEPTALSHHHLSKTRCRFIACDNHTIITTDMGLNCFYITNLKENSTEVISDKVSQSGKDNLRQATGAFVDPAGNMVIAAFPLADQNDIPDLLLNGAEILDTSIPVKKTKNANQELDFARGQLQIFSPNGTFIRSLDNVDIGRPTGVCVDGKNLYIADSLNKVVEYYTITETSPRKRRGSFSTPVPAEIHI
jgi:hypothetical protein